ncbi:hypothetical protein BGZ57DRAFT_848439 [Hyaloscypha finlandica]|nr:hypothetical protein BGZ57DRAFT_848439 [Hyaloscypha finlandica]
MPRARFTFTGLSLDTRFTSTRASPKARPHSSPEAEMGESHQGVIGPMVPGTVDETRCAVWAVLTETEKGPGSPPPAELAKATSARLDIGGFWQTDHLAICWRKMPSQVAGAVAAQRGRTTEQPGQVISNHLSGAKGCSSPAA